MTAATTRDAPPLRLRAADFSRAPRPFNWDMVTVIVAIVAQAAGAVWFESSVDSRVKALEAQLPAGMIQRLDERTIQMQATLARLEAAR